MIFPKTKPIPQQMDIPGYDGRYYVTIDGNVFRRWKKAPDTMLIGMKDRKNGRNREMKLTPPGGKAKIVYMSAIMKATYFSAIPEGYVLEHLNGSEDDWAVHNLRPISRQDLGKRHFRSKGAKAVEKVDPETGEVLDIYRSSRQAGKANHCSYQTILDACNKKNKRRCGIAPDGFMYRWER